MSEPTGDMPDLDVPDVELPDVETPDADAGPDPADTGDLTDEQLDEAIHLADESEVEYGPDGSLQLRDGVDPMEILNRQAVNTGTPEDVASDDSFERWYQKQVASYGQPRGAGTGTGRSRRRGLLGARTTNGAGGGGGFRLGSLLNVNIRFGGGARTTNVTGLSIGGARPGAGARIASRRRR